MAWRIGGGSAWRAGRAVAATLLCVTAVVAGLVGEAGASTVGTVGTAGTTRSGAASAAGSATRPSVSGWLPYWATDASVATVRAHRALFREVSPFWYSLRRDAAATGVTVTDHRLSSGTHASVVAALHAAGVRVLPSVTDGTPARYLAAQLAAPDRRTALVRALTTLAARDGVDGLDLDLEGFAFRDGRATWTTTRPAWIAFVRELGASLARTHRLLVVTIPASDSATTGYWVYDPASIAASVHAVRVMAYDYHVSVAGPVDPLPWVQQVVATTVAAVPAAKVWLGVPAYGRSWVTATTGACPTGTPLNKAVVTPAAAESLAASLKLTRTWDPTTGERTYTYTRTWTGPSTTTPSTRTTCSVTRTVWYDDASSIALRAGVARRAGLAGIAIWSLDTVPAATWTAVARTFGRTSDAATAPATPRTTTAATTAAPTRAAAPRPPASPAPRSSTSAPHVSAAPSATAPSGPVSEPGDFPSAAPDPGVGRPEPTALAIASGTGGDGPVAAPRDPAVRSPWPLLGGLVMAAAAAGVLLLRPRLPVASPAGRHLRPGRHERTHQSQ